MGGLDLLSAAAFDQGSARIRPRPRTIVEILGPELFEVEFSDDNGRTYASLALTVDDLLRLHHGPRHESLICLDTRLFI